MTAQMERAYLGLGANLGDPVAQFERAVAELERSGVSVLARAALYRSAPVGPQDQPEYTNTALLIETALSPLELLELLKRIERALGREDGVRWGPRVIDLDILLYGSVELSSERLTIPHKELAKRRFALQPLADLAPEQVVPGLALTVRALLERLDDDPRSVRRVEPA
jgi:2-amino-4-hydroxy-6-hydroxymethyldihydropteridine diphosphokinase